MSVYRTIGPLVYQILLNLECGVDEYLCFPHVGTKDISVIGKRVLEVFIQ